MKAVLQVCRTEGSRGKIPGRFGKIRAVPIARAPGEHYGQGMRISDVVKRKGDQVVTVRSDATVAELLGLLAEHKIGAVVVSDDGGQVHGIVSERDVVRHLHSEGSAILQGPVRQIMTSEVHTCVPDDELADLAGQMTERRIRHVPVVVDGQLAAIVSIGDVVKSRIDDLQAERDQLRDYIQT